MPRTLTFALALLATITALCLVILGVRTRNEGRDALRAALTRQASDGYGNSLDDLILATPLFDPARQKRAWEWMQSRVTVAPRSSKPLDVSWYLAHAAQPPEKDRQWAEELRPVMRDLRDILDQGPVCFSALGWIRQDAGRLSSSRASTRLLRHARGDLLLEAFRWFALEAMTADDPTSSLDALDALATALDRPGSAVDPWIAGECAPMRDRAFAVLAVRGELPGKRLERWLAEPASGIRWLADGFRAERLLVWAPVGQDLLADSAMGDHFDNQGRVPAWLSGAADCARILEFFEAIEGNLRGKIDAAAVRRAAARAEDLVLPYEDHYGGKLGFDGAWWAATCANGVQWRTEHRLVRIGVLIAGASRKHGRIPLDQTEARRWMRSHASLMDVGAWDVALTFERLSDQQFRIAVDPASSVPAILEGSDETARVRQSPLRNAASKQALRISPGGFEVRIPGND